MRYVRVSRFKGKVLVDIREFCVDKEGDMKLGRKGTATFFRRWFCLWLSIAFSALGRSVCAMLRGWGAEQTAQSV